MPPTRRQFIKHAATAGIALAVSRPSFAIGRTSEIDPVDIKSLGSHLKGQLLLPGDSSYDIARRVFRRNSTTDKRPALIARCTCTEDIQTTASALYGLARASQRRNWSWRPVSMAWRQSSASAPQSGSLALRWVEASVGFPVVTAQHVTTCSPLN